VQERLYDLWLAPVNGLYGIRTPAEPVSDPGSGLLKKAEAACGKVDGKQVPAEVVTPPGNTGPYNSGDLAGAVQVFFFVLAIGAFITVTIKTGALDAGIGRITNRFRKRGLLLIVILAVIFSLGGTTYGMAEETLGFYAIILPVIVALGYDRLVSVGIIMVGAGVGTLASTVNPFATGVASDAAGVALGDGIGLRLIMYIVMVIITLLYVLWYARRVKADPGKSMVPVLDEDRALTSAPAGPPEPMTGRQKVVLWIFGLTFLLMIFSVIPWGDFSASLESITLGWYFPELAALFLVGAVLVGLVGGLGEEGTVTGIIAGAGDFIGAALIIAVARGVTTIMNNASITDSVLHGLESVVSGLPSGAFAVVMYLVNIPLAFLVPSSSGHATLAMPIMAPLGDFAGVSRAMVVTAYQSASGWMNLFTPTSAIVMGGLALSRVPLRPVPEVPGAAAGHPADPHLLVHAPGCRGTCARRAGEIDEHRTPAPHQVAAAKAPAAGPGPPGRRRPGHGPAGQRLRHRPAGALGQLQLGPATPHRRRCGHRQMRGAAGLSHRGQEHQPRAREGHRIPQRRPRVLHPGRPGARELPGRHRLKLNGSGST
jgi:uncharacterized ion transporter superfamily protein YfcC